MATRIGLASGDVALVEERRDDVVEAWDSYLIAIASRTTTASPVPYPIRFFTSLDGLGLITIRMDAIESVRDAR